MSHAIESLVDIVVYILKGIYIVEYSTRDNLKGIYNLQSKKRNIPETFDSIGVLEHYYLI